MNTGIIALSVFITFKITGWLVVNNSKLTKKLFIIKNYVKTKNNSNKQ